MVHASIEFFKKKKINKKFAFPLLLLFLDVSEGFWVSVSLLLWDFDEKFGKDENRESDFESQANRTHKQRETENGNDNANNKSRNPEDATGRNDSTVRFFCGH